MNKSLSIIRRLIGSRPVLAVGASIFAAATLLFSGLWMVSVRWAPGQPDVELGYGADYLPAEHAQLVTSVQKMSPAENAGMRAGDHLRAINGHSLDDLNYQERLWFQHKPGDMVQLSIQRPGQKDWITLTAVFRRTISTTPGEGVTDYVVNQIRGSYLVPFVVVGLTVLFLNLENPYVWLLALLFGTFAGAAPFAAGFPAVPLSLRPFVMAYQAIFLGMLGPLFYCFFAVFPARSPLDRRAPWLKWLGLAIGLFFAVPGLRTGELTPPAPVLKLPGLGVPAKDVAGYILVFWTLGLVSLAWNFVSTPDPEARRKMRVIFWGTAVGVAPILSSVAAENFLGIGTPPLLHAVMLSILFLFPLSFAYAVVKHRVLEIPVLLRRSARYLLVQRGFTFLLALLSIGLTLLFAFWFPLYLQSVVKAAQPLSIALGAVFGTAVLWGGSRVHKQVSGKIDHAFFRSAYDARVILEDLAVKTRMATGRSELAQLLERHICEALHPSSLVVYLRGGDDHLTVASGDVPQGLKTISADLPVLVMLEQRGEPWEYPQVNDDRTAEESILAQLHPDCVAPMLGRSGRLVGLLVLGSRLSEEPYSREDKRLLASVASQAGTALENIHFAEEIAERIESERRVAREMEIAIEVQTRLLPQAMPHLKTLDCAARCIQARSVGGDYYDFLELPPNHLGFVLADVSGKGVPAALLMANLQAHLRSQSASLPHDPVRLLQHVNHVLWKSTDPEHYATLFFGIYDDSTRQLVYANCGHNPPIWLHEGGTVEHLGATATVLGLFEDWECSVGRVQLAPGDFLAVFSDGVTEASANEEEFGEARLLDALRANRHLPVNEIVTTILTHVQQFSGGAQSDDLTLLIARVHS
jgi:sigma-B regulation protein RsbU (phosphoserine phosphatase)